MGPRGSAQPLKMKEDGRLVPSMLRQPLQLCGSAAHTPHIILILIPEEAVSSRTGPELNGGGRGWGGEGWWRRCQVNGCETSSSSSSVLHIHPFTESLPEMSEAARVLFHSQNQ